MLFDKFFSSKNVCEFLVTEGGVLAERHRYFKDFLRHNHEALNRIAELEEIYYAGRPFGMGEVRAKCDDLLTTTRALVKALSGFSQGQHGELTAVCELLGEKILKMFEQGPETRSGRLVASFSELTPESVAYAGAKATNLARAGNILKLPVPDGFVITANAFTFFLAEAGLAGQIAEHLASITPEMTAALEARCAALRELICQAPLPQALADAIFQAYEALETRHGKGVRIALRSSAVGEDTEASFAGQYISRLNVTRDNLLSAYKEVVASKYTPRAILYRLGYGLDDRDTPMCVAGVVMVDAMASGVLYTVDPSTPEVGLSRVSAIWGLGELLVSGEGAADNFLVDRQTGEIVLQTTGRKERRLDGLAGGGTVLREVPENEQELPAVREETVRLLARHGLALESHFGCPQDVEWAVDATGSLFLLQSRPLGPLAAKTDEPGPPAVAQEYPPLLARGVTAARGAAAGLVVRAAGSARENLPENAILVAPTASPDFAAFVGRIKGIITDIGSPASHLASVAREFGVPAIFNAGDATTVLRDGQMVTMVADTVSVYDGLIPELLAGAGPGGRRIYESPLHRRLRAILDAIAPLTLTDPAAPAFAPAGCVTIHDIIRFAHETSMREMFRQAESGKSGALAAKLTANIPLALYCIDLGGGLKAGLTTCDTLIPDHFESIPMKAIWQGLAHPGITWSGSVSVGVGGLMGLMAASASAQAGGGILGGNSYAVLARDYLNLSAKFGYHYANIDAYCSDEPGRNHLLLQFSGGIGDYAGRSLRIHFLASVLGRLGYSISVAGDLLEASLKGGDQARMATVLDQTGRLLAVSRLLDMAIPSLEQADRMTASFFNGDYDFLDQGQTIQLPGFYTLVGQWTPSHADSMAFCRQDGSKWGDALSTGMAKFMGRMVGARYQEFLDNVEAYYYFPIAVAKDSAVISDATIRVNARAEAGAIDRAAGLAFAVRNLGNYFVFRVNALEDNVILFEFVNNRRFTRASAVKKIESARWYELMVDIRGADIKGYLDGELLLEYRAERPLDGYVGLWTKADSVSSFGPISVKSASQTRQFGPEASAD